MKAELPLRKPSILSRAWPQARAAGAWHEMLPLPQESRDRLSLEHHLQLEVLRAGAGSLMSLKLLMRVALASVILQQLGYGRPLPRAVEDYEATARHALDTGAEGRYRFNDAAFVLFAGLVNYHDAQLEIAPWKALSHVAARLEQYSRAA